MDEHADFETRAVLAPKRARASRIALLVPVVAFVAIAWAGLSGPRPDLTAVASPRPTTAALPVTPAPSLAVEVAYPAQVLGLAVHRLAELQIGGLAPDDVVAIAGWYVPTGIGMCPALPALYRDGSLPYLRGDKDKLAFCTRSGLLYRFRPDVVPTGLAVEIVRGVIMPMELEIVGSAPTEVVVVGRFGKYSDGCNTGVGCSRELLVDHVAWTSAAT